MLLNIILSDFQQYRTLIVKVIQFFVSPEKCENQRYKFLTPDRQYAVGTQRTISFVVRGFFKYAQVMFSGDFEENDQTSLFKV